MLELLLFAAFAFGLLGDGLAEGEAEAVGDAAGVLALPVEFELFAVVQAFKSSAAASTNGMVTTLSVLLFPNIFFLLYPVGRFSKY